MQRPNLFAYGAVGYSPGSVLCVPGWRLRFLVFACEGRPKGTGRSACSTGLERLRWPSCGGRIFVALGELVLESVLWGAFMGA
jgi:hypothetical protein